jgi:glycosyltransferase involved in cell wall biosynthesis
MHEDPLPRISVIVPAFNAEGFIGDCLDSLERQAFPRAHYEIIVVDNNSSDRTVEIARRHDRVTVLREPEQSSYIARNRGIAAAGAPVLAFLDSDCSVGPNWLAAIAGAMRNPATQIIIGARKFGRDSLSLRLIVDYENARDRRVFSSTRGEAYYGYAGNMAVRSSVFQRYGLFEPIRRGADSLFVQKVVCSDGCDAVTFGSEMRIRICDIRSFRDYARKVFVYASARRDVGDLRAPRPVSFADRWSAFRTAAARREPVERMWLGCLLTAGCLTWMLGRALRGREMLPSAEAADRQCAPQL